MKRPAAWSILLLTLLIFTALFLYPLWTIIAGGFVTDGQFTTRFLFAVFANPIYAEGLRNSLAIAIVTTLLVALISLPLAALSDRYDFPAKRFFTALLLVPMILPPFVGAIGFQQIFGQYGAFNALFDLGPIDWLGGGRFWGVVILEALSLYPIMYLNVSAALANVDPAMEQAAQTLGAGPLTRFRRITLPLITPGLFAGGTIVFIFSFTDLGVPLMLNYDRSLPVQVFDALKDIGVSPLPYVLIFVMLVTSSLLYLATKLAFGREAHAMHAKASTATVTRLVRGPRAAIILLPFVLVTVLALLPHFGVILTSFTRPGTWYQSVLPLDFTTRNYQDALGHSMTISSIRNSLIYSTLAVLLNTALGLAMAFVIVRSTLRLRWLLDTLAMLPLAVPGLVMAFAYLAISSNFARQPWVKESNFWKSLLDVQTNPTLFLVIAYAMRRLPYLVRAAVAGLQQTSVTLEEAAANLGASPFTTIRRITLPLIFANLIAGAMLAFAFSMLEVSDSLLLAQRQDYYPITKTIYELFLHIGPGKYIASALGVWAMLFLATTIVGATILLGKRLGALFRV